tara:strand:- start:455 stop:1180 length:726 start_codon:yes stop_codon:yes gene_type:complete
MKKLFILNIIILFCISCSDPELDAYLENRANPTEIQHCDGDYHQTTHKTEWSNTEAASLHYSRWSGKISVDPGEVTTRQADITWSMGGERFFTLCHPGNIGVWSSACPYYIECISTVKHKKEGATGDLIFLDYEQTAKYIRPSKVEASDTDDILRACGESSSTYSPGVLGAAIYKEIPETSFEEAMEFGRKGIDDFYLCMCSLAEFLNLEWYPFYNSSDPNMVKAHCEGGKLIDGRGQVVD